jgi:penicillin-binding protein 2
MKKVILLTILSALFAAGIIYRLYILMNEDSAQTLISGGSTSITVDGGYGNIYDRNLVSFTNNESISSAVHVSSEGLPETTENISGVLPDFVFSTPIRYNSSTAVHILGYSGEGGATGIERAYSDYLQSFHTENKVVFQADAKGKVLDGLQAEIIRPEAHDGGVILTLDSRIQSIAETAAKEGGLSKGAVVIMDMKGDIIASVSLPDYDRNRVGDYLDAPDSPLYNRVFAPFAVGSVFKLTAAATALEAGISPQYSYHCKGFINVGGNNFNCHSWAGHGVINIHSAIVTSCNPFFISLTDDLSLTGYYNNVKTFGFGEEVGVAPGMVSAPGRLPSLYDILSDPIERANFSFGQGKLTASPLSICRFTVSIANGGYLPSVRLVAGLADDIGIFENIENKITDNPLPGSRVMSTQTAAFLRYAMYDTIQTSVRTAIPYGVSAAGKTSTAQTGQYKPDGTEIVRVWFTGFFPYENPKYAVTVLCEDGISGTLTAAPIFADIAAKITEAEESQKYHKKTLVNS